MKITVIGTGFVGIVSAAVYSSFGHDVVGLDISEERVASLKDSKVPFYEPDLEPLLMQQQEAGLLTFTTNYQEAINNSEVIIIAVGTPSATDGGADLSYVMSACKSLAPHLMENAIVAIKSTVPPGTLDQAAEVIKKATTAKFFMASLPEFLREGTAVHDTLHPDRVVIGAEDEFVFDKLEELHRPLDSQIVKISPNSAQMAKYTANAYLATRITFINQVADLCAKNGADIEEVIQAISLDERIGSHYWYPGLGYGGSCFPKDVKELAYYSRKVGESGNLLTKIDEINEERIPKLMTYFGEKINDWAEKKVAVLGLSFKPNTNDMREAPSIKVIPWLLDKKAIVKAYDPKALEEAQKVISEHPNLDYVNSIESACNDADVIILLIEWPEIIAHDYSEYRKSDQEQWIIDARNQLDESRVESWGYHYLGIGKSE